MVILYRLTILILYFTLWEEYKKQLLDRFKFRLIISFLLSKIRICLHKIISIFMLFIHPHKAIVFVFLLYNDVYFEHSQRYKKDSKRYIKAQELYISKTIMDEWDLLKKTIGLR